MPTHVWRAALAGAMALIWCACASSTPPSELLTYLESSPTADTSVRLPLVVGLHGRVDRPESFELTRFETAPHGLTREMRGQLFSQLAEALTAQHQKRR